VTIGGMGFTTRKPSTNISTLALTRPKVGRRSNGLFLCRKTILRSGTDAIQSCQTPVEAARSLRWGRGRPKVQRPSTMLSGALPSMCATCWNRRFKACRPTVAYRYEESRPAHAGSDLAAGVLGNRIIPCGRL
jgi:hypothetical protein